MRWLSWAVVAVSFPLGLGCAWYLRDGCDVDRAVLLAAGVQLAIALPASFLGALMSGRSVGGSAARSGAVLAVSVLVAATVLPGVPPAVDRARAVRTAERLDALAVSVARWSAAHQGSYPVAHDAVDLAAALGEPVPSVDAWGNPWHVECDGAHCAVISLGACGEPDLPTADAYRPGTTDDVHADLVMRDGRVVLRPRSARR